MTTRTVVLAALCCAVLPSTALGAYAPRMHVEVDPATTRVPAAVLTTITQAPGETSSQRIVVGFPEAFEPNPATQVASCPVEAEAAGSCPEQSRVGHLEARTALATLAGPVHFSSAAQRLRLLANLRSGAFEQRVVGDVVPRAGGGFDIDFQNLPSLSISAFVLRLDGGSRSLVQTPRSCGRFEFGGSFTSRLGERAVAEAPIEIGGCTALPEITTLRLSRRAFRAVRRAADRSRPGFGTRISWRASEAARTTLRIDRSVNRRWRRAGQVVADGRTGVNRLVFDGRLRGRPLRRGSYRVVLIAVNEAGRSSRPVSTRFRIR